MTEMEALDVLVTEARKWIADAWLEVYRPDMLRGEVVRTVDKHYDGGWEGFERDNKALLT